MTVTRTPSLVDGSARGLIALRHQLRGAPTIPDLLRDACGVAVASCGFTRAVFLGVEDQMLTATGLEALPDPASDSLRRAALARPVPLVAGTIEAELIRRAEGGRAVAHAIAPSELRTHLGLAQFALGPVIAEERVLGLLVADRDGRPVDPPEEEAVRTLAWLLGVIVEPLVLRLRLKELAGELRVLTTSAEAAVREATDAPIVLPSDYGSGPVFANAYPAQQPQSETLRALLTAREQQVASHLVAGRSNREIAAALHLSPETVKAYVARVLRKLGASNRAEAVGRYLRLAVTGDE
jgi:DNA-binding CsgD family transcriptional regulator